MSEPDVEGRARSLAAEAIGAGDPTAWFERLYVGAEAGEEVVPWDRGEPHPLLVEWATERAIAGAGRSALVVGCGLGADAEYVAKLGFATTAFDISPTAVRMARQRHPDTSVRYVAADLLNLPAEWRHAFDLVVESLTLQAMPDPPRRTAIRNIGEPVAPGGTLVVNARAREADAPDTDGPPWALTRTEIETISASGVQPVRIEHLGLRGVPRWRAEFSRSGWPAA
ncbi:MAG TPA: class I SAM-dependent methyltransferase [Streptosporangiaceae bacterium]